MHSKCQGIIYARFPNKCTYILIILSNQCLKTIPGTSQLGGKGGIRLSQFFHFTLSNFLRLYLKCKVSISLVSVGSGNSPIFKKLYKEDTKLSFLGETEIGNQRIEIPNETLSCKQFNLNLEKKNNKNLAEKHQVLSTSPINCWLIPN